LIVRQSIGLSPTADNHISWTKNLVRVLSGNISFGSSMSNADLSANMNCWKASGTTPGTSDTEFAVNHSLGRIPLTIGAQDTNNGGLLYRSTTAWTSTVVYLKCTTASAAYNIILV
jgi:hypothetical protein